ncbi:MAG: nucleotidyltransferase domain-containing protein [Balneolaceae bacterium]
MVSELREHHQRAIENLVNEYKDDSRFPALIIGGSVAKGLAREDSDIDFMIVATDEEFQRRSHSGVNGDLFINRTDLCDYPGGFVDGKIINMEYLHKVANKGNEPSRAAFDGAFIGYSRMRGLDEVFNNIHKYPEEDREQRMKSFYSMAFIQNWLMGEADRHNNLYTQTRAASQLALFAGRLILAHNRVFFPYHKWFLQYIDKCTEKPADFLSNIDSLLKEPSSKTANLLFQSLKDFKDWGVTDLEAFGWFMEEVEWSWMNDNTPLEDL